MRTLRRIAGGAAATLMFGAMVAITAPVSAQAAESPADSVRPLSTTYGPYSSEGTCNYIRHGIPGATSACWYHQNDATCPGGNCSNAGWYFIEY